MKPLSEWRRAVRSKGEAHIYSNNHAQLMPGCQHLIGLGSVHN